MHETLGSIALVPQNTTGSISLEPQEVKGGELGVQGHPQLLSEFEASLEYIIPCLNRNEKRWPYLKPAKIPTEKT